MKTAKAIIIVLLFFFALTFCIQNVDQVTLRYYGLVQDLQAPLFVVVLASVFLGIIIGLIGGGLSSIRLRLQLNKQQKEAKALKTELASLKGEEGEES
jgi:uncharacterized integral membrane protein